MAVIFFFSKIVLWAIYQGNFFLPVRCLCVRAIIVVFLSFNFFGIRAIIVVFLSLRFLRIGAIIVFFFLLDFSWCIIGQ